MPATLAGIKGVIAQLPINMSPNKPEAELTPDDFINVRYRPANVDSRTEALANEMMRTGKAGYAAIEYVLNLLVGWDLKPGPSQEQWDTLEHLKFVARTTTEPQARLIAQNNYEQLKQQIDNEVELQEVIPLTVAGLESIPIGALVEIVKQIGQQINPNPTQTAAP